MSKSRSPIVRLILKCVICAASQSCFSRCSKTDAFYVFERHRSMPGEERPILAFSRVIDFANFWRDRVEERITEEEYSYFIGIVRSSSV